MLGLRIFFQRDHFIKILNIFLTAQPLHLRRNMTCLAVWKLAKDWLTRMQLWYYTAETLLHVGFYLASVKKIKIKNHHFIRFSMVMGKLNLSATDHNSWPLIFLSGNLQYISFWSSVKHCGANQRNFFFTVVHLYIKKCWRLRNRQNSWQRSSSRASTIILKVFCFIRRKTDVWNRENFCSSSAKNISNRCNSIIP